MMFILKNPTLKIVLLLFFSLFFFSAGYAGAQTDTTEIDFTELSAPSVELTTSVGGGVGAVASIVAKTTNIDDNFVSFDWYLDDQPMLSQSGRAKTNFSFPTTKPFHIVRLSIIENNKKIAENTASVSSFAVSLVWNTNTFIPADYEGKAIPIVGSVVTITAFPEIRGEDPQNLLYTWYVDAESRVRNTIAEQEFSFILSKNVSFVSVIVEVNNLSHSISARKAIAIPLTKPQILITHSSPLYLVPGEKVDLEAQPYYFNIPNATSLQYRWWFAGKSILGIPPDPNTLTLSIPIDSGIGSQSLQLTVENLRTPGEGGKASMEIIIL